MNKGARSFKRGQERKGKGRAQRERGREGGGQGEEGNDGKGGVGGREEGRGQGRVAAATHRAMSSAPSARSSASYSSMLLSHSKRTSGVSRNRMRCPIWLRTYLQGEGGGTEGGGGKGESVRTPEAGVEDVGVMCYFLLLQCVEI